VVITAYNCFRNFVKPDFLTTEIKSGELAEMLESHKNDVNDFISKGHIPYSEYTRESVIRATKQYYQASYPKNQLRVAGFTNSIFFILSLLVFYLLVTAAIG
jgi:S-adenosylmethionine:tRNA-ribosyltransferase-isomerase (queuine synthetase)